MKQIKWEDKYYEEYRYSSHYYVCEVTGEGRMHLTDEEKCRGLVPEWIPLQEAIDLFSKHESYADVNEEERGFYQREYMALSEYYDVYEKGVINQSISMEDIKQLPGRESE